MLLYYFSACPELNDIGMLLNYLGHHFHSCIPPFLVITSIDPAFVIPFGDASFFQNIFPYMRIFSPEVLILLYQFLQLFSERENTQKYIRGHRFFTHVPAESASLSSTFPADIRGTRDKKRRAPWPAFFLA